MLKEFFKAVKAGADAFGKECKKQKLDYCKRYIAKHSKSNKE